ncbi:hypothetical protein KM043_001773 [Ampulex compressa]|nr:hypothetical protein KM043_001773 [Ampulex compressa]
MLLSETPFDRSRATDRPGRILRGVPRRAPRVEEDSQSGGEYTIEERPDGSIPRSLPLRKVAAVALSPPYPPMELEATPGPNLGQVAGRATREKGVVVLTVVRCHGTPTESGPVRERNGRRT